MLRSDNGGEYTCDLFKDFCQREGIVRHFTVKGTPQQNGIAERMNHTLLEKVWCMLSNTKLNKRFWAEALFYATFLVNHLPCSGVEYKNLMEL